MTIRALLATDDRSTFQSGDVELDRFFSSYAGHNQFKNHIGVSYVVVDDAGRIVGFATNSVGHGQGGIPGRARGALPPSEARVVAHVGAAHEAKAPAGTDLDAALLAQLGGSRRLCESSGRRRRLGNAAASPAS